MESFEFLDRERVVHLLRENGVENEEAREALRAWCEQKENEATQEAINHPERSCLVNLKLSVELARLKADAGLLDDARDDLYSLNYEARQQELAGTDGASELVAETQVLIEDLERRTGKSY